MPIPGYRSLPPGPLDRVAATSGSGRVFLQPHGIFHDFPASPGGLHSSFMAWLGGVGRGYTPPASYRSLLGFWMGGIGSDG